MANRKDCLWTGLSAIQIKHENPEGQFLFQRHTMCHLNLPLRIYIAKSDMSFQCSSYSGTVNLKSLIIFSNAKELRNSGQRLQSLSRAQVRKRYVEEGTTVLLYSSKLRKQNRERNFVYGWRIEKWAPNFAKDPALDSIIESWNQVTLEIPGFRLTSAVRLFQWPKDQQSLKCQFGPTELKPKIGSCRPRLLASLYRLYRPTLMN